MKIEVRQKSPLTFPVVTEAHLGLSKTNGVFSLTDAIELLQLGLINTLHKGSVIIQVKNHKFMAGKTLTYLTWKIYFNGFNANVLRARRHRGEAVNPFFFFFFKEGGLGEICRIDALQM